MTPEEYAQHIADTNIEAISQVREHARHTLSDEEFAVYHQIVDKLNHTSECLAMAGMYHVWKEVLATQNKFAEITDNHLRDHIKIEL